MTSSPNLQPLARRADISAPCTSAAPASPAAAAGAASTLRIGLLWHSANSGNLGVGALTISNIAIVERLAGELGLQVEFLILGWQDAGLPLYVEAPNVRVVPLNARAFGPGGAFAAAVRTCDFVLDIGAGDSFADIYGRKRFAYMVLSKLLAQRTGRPLILSPQTIGPFRNPLGRHAAAWLIRRSDLVFARDTLSVDYTRALAPRQEVLDTIDVAFRLPFERPAPHRSAPDKVAVGVNVSALLYYGGYTRNNMFGLTFDFPTLINRLLADLSARPEVELHLVPHVHSQNPVEDDTAVAWQLRDAHPAVRVAGPFRSPSEAKSYISGLDFFVGARMHACIAALSAGVPVVPLAYSRKFTGLFAALGYAPVIDGARETTDGALAQIEDAYARRGALAVSARAATEKAHAKLAVYEDALRSLMARTATRTTSARR